MDMNFFQKSIFGIAVLALAIGFGSCASTAKNEPAAKIGVNDAPHEVGDIVFYDGSATPYSEDLVLTDEQKNAAIAVIFHVGTECSNDDKTRILGLGLVQHEKGIAFATSEANVVGTSKNGLHYLRRISEISCDEKKMIFLEDADKDGSDNLSQIGAFLKDNDLFDDTSNSARYPAFYFAKNYAKLKKSHVQNKTFAKGWYLPTYCEYFTIWKNREIVNAALRLCGGTDFDMREHETSSADKKTHKYRTSSTSDMNGGIPWLFASGHGTNIYDATAESVMFGGQIIFYACAIRAF